MGRRPVWKAERQNGAAAGKTVCKCGGPQKNISFTDAGRVARKGRVGYAEV